MQSAVPALEGNWILVCVLQVLGFNLSRAERFMLLPWLLHLEKQDF